MLQIRTPTRGVWRRDGFWEVLIGNSKLDVTVAERIFSNTQVVAGWSRPANGFREKRRGRCWKSC